MVGRPAISVTSLSTAGGDGVAALRLLLFHLSLPLGMFSLVL